MTRGRAEVEPPDHPRHGQAVAEEDPRDSQHPLPGGLRAENCEFLQILCHSSFCEIIGKLS